MSGPPAASKPAATPPAAPDGRPRQAVHRRQTARRLPLAGPGRRRRAQADPRHPRANRRREREAGPARDAAHLRGLADRSEEHTSELQSPCNLVCRLLLEKKKKTTK